MKFWIKVELRFEIDVSLSDKYIVSVPDLPGCITQGDTLEKAIDNVKDAIEAYITSLVVEHRDRVMKDGARA